MSNECCTWLENDRVERCAPCLRWQSWYSRGISASLSLSLTHTHTHSLSPLLPWQHIFCMEIASLAVPRVEKKALQEIFNVSRADLSSEIWPADWMEVSNAAVHVLPAKSAVRLSNGGVKHNGH